MDKELLKHINPRFALQMGLEIHERLRSIMGEANRMCKRRKKFGTRAMKNFAELSLIWWDISWQTGGGAFWNCICFQVWEWQGDPTPLSLQFGVLHDRASKTNAFIESKWNWRSLTWRVKAEQTPLAKRNGRTEWWIYFRPSCTADVPLLWKISSNEAFTVASYYNFINKQHWRLELPLSEYYSESSNFWRGEDVPLVSIEKQDA